MILRNKKTGEIIKNACIGVFMHKSSGDCERVDTEARSLEKVLEEWEDYKPTEPLIKDEKIRKAVRAWAEINLILDDDDVEASTPTVDCNVLTLTYGTISIDVFVNDTITIINHGHYTITELCGEEEE